MIEGVKIMILEHLVVGELGTNCYIVGCPETKEAVVIDPGGNVDSIIAKIAELKLQVRYIINTHGHYDHILGNKSVKEHTQADILIHELDADYLKKPALSLSSYFGEISANVPANRLLHEDEIINIGKSVSLKVIHTPGHTPGGISLLAGKNLFSGDTLFAGSVGRTDLPGGSMENLIAGIKTKLLHLDDDIIVYPGHGPFTTIGDEKTNNPYLA